MVHAISQRFRRRRGALVALAALLAGAAPAAEATPTADAAPGAGGLPRPEVPDPYGLGDRLALIDYLKTQLHATVAPGAGYDDLVRQYWSLVKPPADAAQETREKAQRLRTLLHARFAINTDEGDPDRLAAMIVAAEAKSASRSDPASIPDPPDAAEVPRGVSPGPAPAPAPPGSGQPAPAAPGPAVAGNGPATPAAVAPAAPFVPPGVTSTTVTLAVPGATAIDLQQPYGWTASGLSQAGGELLMVSPDGGTRFSLKVMPLAQSVLATTPLDAAVEGICEKVAAQSVEQAVVLRTLYVNQGACRFAEFTDKAYVNGDPPAGQHKVAALGIFSLGATAGVFTLVGGSLGDPQFETGRSIISSIAVHRP
jgi:hypothetical protein